MRRREGNDKFMGRPMFPRLHVNDTEKGGPRAPPRNKMALYEQLNILSQSYNSGGGGVTPTLNANNNIGSVPSTSRNQGISRERRMDLPMDQPSLPSLYSHTELQDTEVVDLSNQPAQMEQGLKAAQKDDLVVPIFSQHGVGQCTGTTYNSGDGERLLNNGDRKVDHSGGDLISRQHGINQGRRTFRVSDAPKRYLEISKREKQGLQSGQQDNCTLTRSDETEVCLRQHMGNGLPAVETRFGEGDSGPPMESTRKDISLRLEHNSCIGYACGESNGIDNGMQRIDDCSWEMENVDRADDMSETSILDSASALDISAEDIVGIIGVNFFLRARSAIANQQRVLAAQVFELHRLIKVQGLIAGSPYLLKDSVFMNKTSKDSNMKKYSPEFSVKAIAHAMKNKDDPEDPYDEVKCTAENAVSKAPPVSALKSLPPVSTDPEMKSWSFHQPASHQWLVPMRCPSQGLVYRQCPAPGFMSPVLGGYGALGSTPAVGNLMNSAYGMPPGTHYCGQGYFYPHGMPIMSPSVSGPVMDQLNKFSQGHPHGQMGRPVGVSTRCSSNEPIQKKGTDMPVSKAGDLQRSTTISPSHQARGLGTAHLTKCGDAPPLSPVSTVTGVLLGPPSTKKSARVIRLIPRDRGSTRESAARIFRSIQEERQQQGSN